eukprot:308990_1
MGNAFGSLTLTGRKSKRKRDDDACAFIDGKRNTQQNHQQVVLGSSGDHHRRGVEHGEEECNRAVNRKGEKRRRNRRKSSPERDHCNAQNCGLLDGRGAAKSLSHRMGEEGGTYRNNIAPHKGSYGGELFSQLTPQQKEEVTLKHLEKIDPTKKKKKVGLLLAYTGTNYPGLQINPGLRSIEAELEKALFLSGSILSTNFGCPRKICWSRSARTDKGVHAVGNLISAKLLIRPGTEGCDELRNEVNSHLPNDICVLDVARLMSSFSAYTCCERRKYYYLMPAACLLPAKEVDPLLRTCILSSGEIDKKRLSCIAQDLRNCRCTKSQLELLRSILRRYEGTHSYHNFTKGKLPTDASAKRFILSAIVGEPEIHQGQQWIPLEYVGSSFMIHQIRKMTGLAIFICRGSQAQ